MTDAVAATSTAARTPTGLRGSAPLIVASVLFAAGAFAMHRLLHGIAIGEIVASVRAIAPTTAALAVLATLGSYAALVGYDRSALRYIGRTAPLPLLITGSFTANALGNTIGLSAVSGGAVRWRVYRSLGLEPAQIAIVSGFCALSLGLGLVVLGLVGLAFAPEVAATRLALAPDVLRVAALLALIVLVGGALALSISGRSLSIRRNSLSMPRVDILGEQLLYTIADMTLAAATLYVLLPDSVSIGFAPFVAIFAVAALVAVISHVPGGIGVFESVVIAGVVGLSTTSAGDTAGLVAALFAYRAIYYLMPFLLALVVLALLETMARGGVVVRHLPTPAALRNLAEESGPLLVLALSVVVFLIGAVLLLNGLVPIPADLVAEVLPLVPIAVLEVSNVVLGVVGAGLVLLSNALRQRIRAAYWISLALLGIACASLVAQSIDRDIAVVVALVAALLWSTRREFYRASRLSSRVFSREWLALVGALVLSLVLVFAFAHRETNYSTDLWWQVATDAHTPRALRLLGAAAAVTLISVLFFALRPALRQERRNELPDDVVLARIIETQRDPDAGFVYTGDKEVLMNEDKNGFIMYARRGRTLVALGDPIGSDATAPGLIDAFVTLADRENRRPAFYRITPRLLTTYIDVGFSLSKLGESAEIDLIEFSLAGSARAKLRQRHAKSQRDGLSLEWRDLPHEADLIESLRPLSDDWLSAKSTREKGFSLGHFDADYLARYPLALVRHEQRIVAFANVLVAGSSHATIDLMRYGGDAPSGTMDFLFVALMLQLKEHGYEQFSLGTAPLVGLDRARHKRLWDHLGNAVSTFGGRFYNFEGLRDYKNKFAPRWEPRYMATWGGMDPLLVAADVNALVSGGIRSPRGGISATRQS